MTASWCSQSELVLLSDLCQLRLPLGLQYQLRLLAFFIWQTVPEEALDTDHELTGFVRTR